MVHWGEAAIMLTVPAAGAAVTLVAERTAARKARENCMIAVWWCSGEVSILYLSLDEVDKLESVKEVVER
jgi:hypothetical protein